MRQTALKHAKQAETGWWLSISKYRDEQWQKCNVTVELSVKLFYINFK